MAERREVQEHMQRIVCKLNDVGAVDHEDRCGAVLFLIKDLHTGWKLRTATDGSVESCVETTDESDCGVLEMDSDTFVGVYSKKIDVFDARDEGKIEVRGGLGALIKLMPHTV